MLLKLSHLAATTVFRLLPVSGTDKDIEILALRHQLAILQRQIGRPRRTGTDRVFLAALLHHLVGAQERCTCVVTRPFAQLRMA